jgi:lysophospholipase L1-like esterase
VTATRRRWLLVIIAPFVILLTMELLLQVAALVVQANTREMPSNWFSDNTRLLAIGDSHTFGIYVDPEEAYPAQLEARWNERYPEHAIEVLNLAYPGMNSFRILGSIDSMVEKFRPDVVLLTVGVNDLLTPVEEIAYERDSALAYLMRAVGEHSRLFYLVRMLKQSHNEPVDIKIEHREIRWSDDHDKRMEELEEFKQANRSTTGHEVMNAGGEKYVVLKRGEPAYSISSLEENLSKIDAAVTSHGADFYLLTYSTSGSYYRVANETALEYASSNPTKFIDVGAEFSSYCLGARGCRDLFFEDFHPKAEGYTVVASIVLDRLARDWSLSRQGP